MSPMLAIRQIHDDDDDYNKQINNDKHWHYWKCEKCNDNGGSA